MSEARGSRVGAARRRAHAAKVALACAGAVTFVVATALARAAFPGHAKKPVTALAPPGRFVEIVRRNQLQSGILAPAQADPAATTSQT